jgi:hypothetical protein
MNAWVTRLALHSWRGQLLRVRDRILLALGEQLLRVGEVALRGADLELGPAERASLRHPHVDERMQLLVQGELGEVGGLWLPPESLPAPPAPPPPRRWPRGSGECGRPRPPRQRHSWPPPPARRPRASCTARQRRALWRAGGLRHWYRSCGRRQRWSSKRVSRSRQRWSSKAAKNCKRLQKGGLGSVVHLRVLRSLADGELVQHGVGGRWTGFGGRVGGSDNSMEKRVGRRRAGW